MGCSCRRSNYTYMQKYKVPWLHTGNNPWPIGVTSVGIHERSAREKISHVMNGGAHIMNDEATRKYLQAVKRLLTFVQRAYPTDPSRSVDFDGFRDAGRGAAGSGSDKQVLMHDCVKPSISVMNEAECHHKVKDGPQTRTGTTKGEKLVGGQDRQANATRLEYSVERILVSMRILSREIII